jgi:hypothetical protein
MVRYTPQVEHSVAQSRWQLVTISSLLSVRSATACFTVSSHTNRSFKRGNRSKKHTPKDAQSSLSLPAAGFKHRHVLSVNTSRSFIPEWSRGLQSRSGQKYVTAFPCVILLWYRTCDGLIPHPRSPIACLNKDLEDLYNRRDQGSNVAVAPRGTAELNRHGAVQSSTKCNKQEILKRKTESVKKRITVLHQYTCLVFIYFNWLH